MTCKTEITERQRLAGIINGTDARFVKSEIYQSWLNIVQQHSQGLELSQEQVRLLELVNRESCANRHRARQRNSFNHAVYRLPQTVRG